ncbi:hypothetical protein RB653_008993 [Dictyostelium firmibasis]|uniref:IPT/TIG domain-containing protein n=1 Tax=Dictyostelium firmibasis TaxID=79012 RepID=A0AAN7U067_9MYCE
MNIKFSIFLFLLLIILTCCDVSVLNFYNNETTVVFEYNLQSQYFTKWIYFDSKYNATFSCSINTNTRICSFTPIESDLKKLYSNAIYFCTINPSTTTTKEECNYGSTLGPVYYPTPMISYQPPTKGGQVNIIGSFLITNGYNFPTQIGDVRVLIPSIGPIDPTNITIQSFPSGCGQQTVKYYNDKYFKFQYADPIINNITFFNNNNDNGDGLFNVTLIVYGDNFCSPNDSVTISVGSNRDMPLNWIDSNGTVSVQYFQKTSGLAFVSINACGLNSQRIFYFFDPEIKSVTSVSKFTGGIITITGRRLTPMGQDDTSVTIGTDSNNKCNIISTSYSTIKCSLNKYNGSSGGYTNLSINLRISGQSPQDSLSNTIKYSYGIPFISGQLLTGMNLTLYGVNFGDNQSGIYINDFLRSDITPTVSQNETQISFILPSGFQRSNLSIFIPYNNLKSNQIVVDANFNIEALSNSNTRGQLLPFSFKNILSKNFNSKPIVIYNSNELIYNESLSTTFFSLNRSANYYFEIPPGCGLNNFIQGKIGIDQIANSTVSYSEPVINNCQNDDFSIVCVGYNFGNLSTIFSNSKYSYRDDIVKINFSNEIFTFKNISKLDHEIFVIPLKPNKFHDGNISINVCGSLSNSYTILFNSSIKNEGQLLNQTFNSNGGDIIINGHNFNFEKSNLTYLLCNNTNNNNNQQIKFNCNFINNTIYTCPISLIGPFDRNCTLNFQNQEIYNISISYLQPIINSINNNKLETTGGSITIIGGEFYNLKTMVTIGDLNCTNVTFINSNQLTCNLSSKNISNQLIVDKLYYVNITIFDDSISNSSDLVVIKRSSSLIFKYSKLYNESANNSVDGGGGSSSNRLKWLIPTIICPVVFIVMVIFIGPELFRRFYTYPPPKPSPPEPGFIRRPYNPPNLNNRLYENVIPQYDNDPENPPQLSFVPIQP